MTPDDNDAAPNFALPLAILAAAFVASALGGTLQLIRENNVLTGANEAQARAAGDSERIRHQIDALVAGTTALADQGDVTAKAAVGALARQGVIAPPTPSK